MKNKRRDFIHKSAIGIFGTFPVMHAVQYEISAGIFQPDLGKAQEIDPLYPSTDIEVVRKVVGAAHTQLEEVQKLVGERPELAKASYDWGFGDVESALGAASHMGRKDIAEFLIEYGARPDIFAFAMLGKVETVKAMIEEMPGVQRILGPHGFTLLHHATMPLRRKLVEGSEKEAQEALVAFLTELGDADMKAKSLEITDEERQKYLGKYHFGSGPIDYFEVAINGMDVLSISRGDDLGRALLRTDVHSFAPGGAPSVVVKFEFENEVAKILTIHDPTPVVKAIRI